MFKAILFYSVLLVAVCTSLHSTDSSSAPPDRNWHYQVASTCVNTSSNNCYPIHYENADGNSNIFANYVAYLNILSPMAMLVAYKVGHYFVGKWNKQIEEEIEQELKTLLEVEEALRTMLGEIIRRFDNGIGAGTDPTLVRSMIQSLNKGGCSICIEEFVRIVSREPDSSQRKVNRKQFRKFVRNWEVNSGQAHEHSVPSTPLHTPPKVKSPFCCGESCERAWHAFWKKWNHPLHWSSFAFTFGGFAATIPIAVSLDVDNRAGSWVGDLANASNALFIPTAYAFSVFQHWKNLDREKDKLLEKEFSKRFEQISGIIEIAARIIGKMDNGISISEARGFIKALMITGWDQTLAQSFANLASRDCDIDKGAFINALNQRMKQKNSPYYDDDIACALEPRSSHEDIRLESMPAADLEQGLGNGKEKRELSEQDFEEEVDREEEDFDQKDKRAANDLVSDERDDVDENSQQDSEEETSNDERV